MRRSCTGKTWSWKLQSLQNLQQLKSDAGDLPQGHEHGGLQAFAESAWDMRSAMIDGSSGCHRQNGPLLTDSQKRQKSSTAPCCSGFRERWCVDIYMHILRGAKVLGMERNTGSIFIPLWRHSSVQVLKPQGGANIEPCVQCCVLSNADCNVRPILLTAPNAD